MQIEIAFGLLTTKWRILQRRLTYKNKKNAKIISVATKLHNVCIRMKQKDIRRRVGIIANPRYNRVSYGIEPLTGSQNNGLGYNPVCSEDDPTVPPFLK